MNFSYGRMYDNARQYMSRMQAQPFMGSPQPQGQMSAPLQMPQQAPANYSAIAQQMAPPPTGLVNYGTSRQPQRGIA